MDKRTETAIQKALLSWYSRNRRSLPWRESGDPYRVWVSEVMLQQTRIETVIPYYHRFMKRFPDIFSLAEADLETLLKIWEGLGYYSRARNMHRAAKLVVQNHGGVLPQALEGLKSLPGIGDYIAAAVGSICFQIPAAVVDGNVKRVLARLFTMQQPVNDVRSKKVYMKQAQMLLGKAHPGTFNQAVMELGQRICTPRNPGCRHCPLEKNCRARENDQVPHYPVRLSRAKTPLKKMVYAVIERKGKWLVVKRPESGLLGGMWELPGGELPSGVRRSAGIANMFAQKYNLRVGSLRKKGTVRHAYTHFRVSADIYLCRHVSGRVTAKETAGHRWILPGEIDCYPFHTLMHKAFALLKKI